MPWKEVDKMSLKKEFVHMAMQEGTNVTELCRRYEISRSVGYDLIKRYNEEGVSGLEERSSRPNCSPSKTPKDMENLIVAVRDKHWSWGGRKIYHYLVQKGYMGIPHFNTITDILRRNGRLNEWRKNQQQGKYIRFERESANDLWQMDFKGDFPLMTERCYPLTILDDHSRFALSLEACVNQRTETVKQQLIEVFRRYGLPWQINVDNGPPWGEPSQKYYTTLAVWIMRIGVKITFSRPHHPQTNGKDERFHKTLKQEVLNRYSLKTLNDCQRRFDLWRDEYNNDRPHEALNYKAPVTRYQISERKYPETMPEINYFSDDIVRIVYKGNSCINFKGKQIFVGYAFSGEPVAIRPSEQDGCYNIFYCQQKIKGFNLRGDYP